MKGDDEATGNGSMKVMAILEERIFVQHFEFVSSSDFCWIAQPWRQRLASSGARGRHILSIKSGMKLK